MAEIIMEAPAKINLSLDILGKRPDGYHELRMVMQSIGLHDTLRLKTTPNGVITARSSLNFLPCDDRNLAVRAARVFLRETGRERQGLAIEIEKRIPVCAGMGGGSSDGAAVLRALRDLFCPEMKTECLERMGEAVGSDVPYCVRGGTVLAEGRGERLTTLEPLPACFVVAVKPNFSISTPALFAQVGTIHRHPDTAGLLEALKKQDLDGVCRRVFNVFEEVLPPKLQELLQIKKRLLELGARAAAMTGSGPTVFGIFSDEAAAKRAFDLLSVDNSRIFLEKTL